MCSTLHQPSGDSLSALHETVVKIIVNEPRVSPLLGKLPISRVTGQGEVILPRTRSQSLAPPPALRLPPALCFDKFGSLAALSPTLIST
jgi:hypothetical protein